MFRISHRVGQAGGMRPAANRRRWILSGLLLALFVLGAFGVPRGPLSATAQERPVQAGLTVNDPAGGQGEDSIFNHYPIDVIIGDYGSMEFSGRGVFNYEVKRSGVRVKLGKGPEGGFPEPINDVLEFFAIRRNASGEIRIRRRADGSETVIVQGEMGLFTEDSAPLLNGIVRDVSFGVFEIINPDDRGERVFAGFTPTTNGVKAYGGLRENGQDQFFPQTPTFPGATAIDVDLQKGRRMRNGGLQDFTQVRVRETGTRGWTTLYKSAELVPVPAEPATRLEVEFSVGGLNPGGRVYFDDIFTWGLNGSAEQPVIDNLMEAAGHNIQVFDELLKPNFDSAEAVDHLTDGIDMLQNARQLMRTCDCQPSTRISKAVGATRKALKFNQQAITAIQAGQTNDAIEAVLKAVHQKAKAGLYMRGHNPKKKNKRFDKGDDPQLFDLDELPPGIFADGFESGDVNAWSL